MIHLKHKNHGFHIAYTEPEAKACMSNGWVKCDIEKEIALKVKGNTSEAVEAEPIAGENTVTKEKPKNHKNHKKVKK